MGCLGHALDASGRPSPAGHHNDTPCKKWAGVRALTLRSAPNSVASAYTLPGRWVPLTPPALTECEWTHDGRCGQPTTRPRMLSTGMEQGSTRQAMHSTIAMAGHGACTQHWHRSSTLLDFAQAEDSTQWLVRGGVSNEGVWAVTCAHGRAARECALPRLAPLGGFLSCGPVERLCLRTWLPVNPTY